MEHPRDFEQVIFSLLNIDWRGDITSENAKKISEDLNSLLHSEDGVRLLTQHLEHFEVVLPLFIGTIFHPYHHIAQPCLKHCDAVVEIFRAKSPKVKMGLFKEFEKDKLIGLIETLKPRVEANDEFWLAIWIFVCQLVICDNIQAGSLNKLLSVTELAFKNKSNDRADVIHKAWSCWRVLIEAFGRYPKSHNVDKTINLLLKPLQNLSFASKSHITTWIHLVEMKELSGVGELVKSVVEPMLRSMYQLGEKSLSRNTPDDCASALVKMLPHDHVVEHCLPKFIEIFGACVNSRPSAGLIEQLSSALVKSINDWKDDGASYKLWKALLEQYTSCAESPILSQACQNIFKDINFLRWVDSGTIEAKDISVLMRSVEFREDVLLRSIKALTFDDHADTPNKKKSRKGSYEDVWSNYCEAYISWWSHQLPPSPKQNEKPEATQSLKDSCDYQAVQFLLLQPIQFNNMWNPTVCKTWALLCAACHTHKFLHNFVKALFDSVCEPEFQVQKAIDIADCLYKLDNSFCKLSARVLDTLSSSISSMEFQSLLDVLNLSETAMLYPEMSSVLGKICKNSNDKIADYDHLNAHKIRTKVSKITRKLEQQSSLTEKDKQSKVQRAPFMAQSNFLHRLAKAEEKNKTKSLFLTMFSSEKVKNGVENGDHGQYADAASMNSPQENGVNDNSKKPITDVDDNETVSSITLSPLLKKSPADTNGHAEGIVAEKEMVLPTINGASPTASHKLKITNAREVKTVDSSSPAAAKKPKPIAGLKTTPKKLTPSKVSYFDDDANDCVMVPPKPKTTPLTEHQMEMMSKRRTDIPALYQDLSQDTQSQHIAVLLEVTTGVSPRAIRESQDIVPGTPSPEDAVAASTPEHQKSSGKTSTSAKKLDFNNLCTPPSKASLVNDFHRISPTPEHSKSEVKNNLKQTNGIHSAEIKDEKPLVSGQSDSEEHQIDPSETEVKLESQPATEEKLKRKRKSEPTKFSPKLTRSKKNLKSATPDAKLTKLSEPNSNTQLTAKSPDQGDKLNRPESPKPNVEIPELPEIHKRPIIKKCLMPIKSESPEPSSKIPMDVTNDAKTTPEKKCDVTQSNGFQGSPELSSQIADDILPSSQNESKVPEPVSLDKPKKGRKRKMVESSNIEIPKKVKPSEEDVSNAEKKSDSAKKKKPFKLGANLENWLVKTERVCTPVPEPEIKIEMMESCDDVFSDPEKAGSESFPNGTVIDYDNSEEIVPSTQEFVVDDHKLVLPVSETKDDGKVTEELIIIGKIENGDGMVAGMANADSSSPEKPEGSVFERLSHESPNDDIDLIISPCKRQRRATSVFRGEGDTYLEKENFWSTASEEPEEEPRTARTKKTMSPSSKKRLQLGGRSAKMLRLATSSASSNSAQEDNDEIVVTPSRRRENIPPVKYGENWPKGPREDWVACTPQSPYMSPFRGVLKKTPRLEENMTPQRTRNDMVSPLLSSAKRKRVIFLDPPVTRGLLYDVDSPSGSIHHADVPQGSPYPTWRGEDDESNMEVSPSKRDAERLNSLADPKTNSVLNENNPEGSPRNRRGRPKRDPQPCTSSDVSEEVRQLIDPAEPTIVPRPEPDMAQLQAKFDLSDDFMTQLSATDARLRSLLMQYFYCTNMKKTVRSWTSEDRFLVHCMPKSFLLSVRNLNGEFLTDILTFNLPPESLESATQTEQHVLVENSSQTAPPPLSRNSDSQTIITKSKNVETSTELATTTSSTQCDQWLPSAGELPPGVKEHVESMSSQQFASFVETVASIWRLKQK